VTDGAPETAPATLFEAASLDHLEDVVGGFWAACDDDAIARAGRIGEAQTSSASRLASSRRSESRRDGAA
jgi:hypothetical protein